MTSLSLYLTHPKLILQDEADPPPPPEKHPEAPRMQMSAPFAFEQAPLTPAEVLLGELRLHNNMFSRPPQAAEKRSARNPKFSNAAKTKSRSLSRVILVCLASRQLGASDRMLSVRTHFNSWVRTLAFPGNAPSSDTFHPHEHLGDRWREQPSNHKGITP